MCDSKLIKSDLDVLLLSSYIKNIINYHKIDSLNENDLNLSLQFIIKVFLKINKNETKNLSIYLTIFS